MFFSADTAPHIPPTVVRKFRGHSAAVGNLNPDSQVDLGWPQKKAGLHIAFRAVDEGEKQLPSSRGDDSREDEETQQTMITETRLSDYSAADSFIRAISGPSHRLCKRSINFYAALNPRTLLSLHHV